MKQKPQTISQAYDIASAFITDSSVQIVPYVNSYFIEYCVIKHGLADYPYCLTVRVPRRRDGFCKDGVSSRGKILVHRGTGSVNSSHPRVLLSVGTLCDISRASDSFASDLSRFLSRCSAPSFFKICDLVQSRMMGQVKTTDNTKKLFDMMYQLREFCK